MYESFNRHFWTDMNLINLAYYVHMNIYSCRFIDQKNGSSIVFAWTKLIGFHIKKTHLIFNKLLHEINSSY